MFNCVVTNVPGSRVPLYFAGAQMVAMYGTGPIFDSMGLINTIYRYVDTIAISFTSDRDMMPDPARLCRCAEIGVRCVEGGGGARRPAKPTKGRRRSMTDESMTTDNRRATR